MKTGRQRSRKLMLLLLMCLIAIGCGKEPSPPERIPGLWIIDCTVPGTELFLRGQKLGVTPLELDAKRLSELGVKEPVGMEVLHDGWCEGIFFGVEDEQEERVMFRVPDDQSGLFCEIETPWGRRTKIAGSSWTWTAPNTRLYRMMRTGSCDKEQDLSIVLSEIGELKRGDGEVTLNVTCTNVSANSIDAEAASITARWGSFDTPWRRRNCRKVELDSEWLSIPPSAEREVQLKIPTPAISEDYSVFVTLWLEGTDVGGSTYSNSRWLRVR